MAVLRRMEACAVRIDRFSMVVKWKCENKQCKKGTVQNPGGAAKNREDSIMCFSLCASLF